MKCRLCCPLSYKFHNGRSQIPTEDVRLTEIIEITEQVNLVLFSIETSAALSVSVTDLSE